MDANTAIPLWVTLLGVAAPLLALAGSAIAYVISVYRDAGEKKRGHFFDLMDIIDSQRPIASKMAAVYELRNFPEHKDFIIRFCDAIAPQISGAGARALQDEMAHTCDHLGR